MIEIRRGQVPVIIAFPHTGTAIPPDLMQRFVSPWLARKDTDWFVDQLYGFAGELGVTTVRTPWSRSVIDVNRDPGGATLYPGQATTELCPTTTFDGEPLYQDVVPDADEIAVRRSSWFDPYHTVLADEIARLRAVNRRVVLYDAHSIRSRVPRLFDGRLPLFNIGTDDGRTCDPALSAAVATVCDQRGSTVVNGRFRGGWTTRHYGRPGEGVDAIQMEIAMDGYLEEPATMNEHSWPPEWSPARAAPLMTALREAVEACVRHAGRA